jgi:YD repeat-containing protein
MDKKILFRLATLSLLILKGVYGNAQVNNHEQIAVLKNVVPPSPNSASLGKYGEWPVSLYTGVPNISIPIYELKGSSVSVPISLSYHAGGNKVGDIASWVGLGWSLNAGGCITRSIRGLPDEGDYFVNAANFSNPNDFGSSIPQNLLSIMKVASAKNNTDTQEDMYTLNALGKSYRFVIRVDGSMQTIPFSGIKLTANPMAGANPTADTWIIVLEDGTRLLFGGTGYIETTDNPRFPLGDGHGIVFTSSWMLQSITSPSGEVVTFTYTNGNSNIDSYYSQSDFLECKTSFYTGGPPTTCGNVNQSFYTKSTIERQQINTLNLSAVESDLGRVEFIMNAAIRQDLPGNKALQEIKVYSKPAAQYIEDFILATNYSTAISSNSLPSGIPNETYLNYRLRLNSLEKKDLQNPSSLGQKWIFDYNPQNLPARRSFAQDHWGFFNGATSNTTLLPEEYFVIPQGTILLGAEPKSYGFMPSNHDRGGNREGDASYLQAEMLTTINYPTGGHSNFTYEANAIPVTEEKWTRTNTDINFNVYPGMNPPSSTSSVSFTITKPQYVMISLNSYISQSILNDQPTARTSARILNQSGTSIVGVGSPSVTSWSGSSYFNLLTAGTYTFQAWTSVDPLSLTSPDYISINATLQYDLSNGMQSYNKLTGGLRIGNIADYDGISSTSINYRSYVYEQPLILNPVNITYDYLTNQEKWTHNGTTTESCFYTTTTRNSSSRFALGSIQGGTVAYGKVTTFYGLNGSNGKTVSLFSNEPDDHLTESKLFPYSAPDSRDHRRGLLLEETHYKSDLTTILTKNIHTYSFTPIGYVIGFKSGYSVNMDPYFCTNTYHDCGITRMYQWVTSEQVKSLSGTTITYDQNGQNPLTVTTNYFYDNPNNLNPIRIETTDSKGNIIKSISRGPLEKTDINSSTPLTAIASAAIDTMLARNIISPVLQQMQYKANVVQNLSLINYKNWSTSVLQPENIQSQIKNNPIETRIQFNKYDANGNLQEQQKANDVKECYIWGYGNQYPVARIVGTDYNTAVQYVNLTTLNNPATTEQQMKTELNNLRTGLAGANALVTTYTYKPLIGVSSETDPNGHTTTYEYDNFNRLSIVRDKDNKIVKKICYNYAGQAENCTSACSDFTPNWQNTSTPPTCQQGSCGNTGYQLQEQRDMNPCSPTYNQTQWIVAGYNPTTCPLTTNVNITYQNPLNLTGFTVVYTNTGTNQTYTFSVPTGNGSFGCIIPPATYFITISKPGNTAYLTFSCGCKVVDGTSAWFGKTVVSSTSCNSITIDNPN